MARWTKRYKLPAKVRCSTTVTVGKEIWIMPMNFNPPKHEIVIFNTETRSFTTVECQLPDTIEKIQFVFHTAVYDDKIYMLCRNRCRDEAINTLYQLDTKTLQLEYVLNTKKNYQSFVVRGDLLYILDCSSSVNVEWTKKVPTFLDTIDLKTKEVVDFFPLMDTDRSVIPSLTTNNDQLYLVSSGSIRSVAIIEDRKIRVLQEESYNIEKNCGRYGGLEDLNETTGYFQNGMFSILLRNSSDIHLDKFNYSENQWERTTAEKSWVDKRMSRMWHFVEVDNIFYAILYRANSRSWMEVRLLEKSPDASTRSLLNMIDFCVDNNEMNKLRECGEYVPEADKENWERMIDWRIAERSFAHRIKLAKCLADAGKVEVQKMFDEGIICKDMFNAMNTKLDYL